MNEPEEMREMEIYAGMPGRHAIERHLLYRWLSAWRRDREEATKIVAERRYFVEKYTEAANIAVIRTRQRDEARACARRLMRVARAQRLVARIHYTFADDNADRHELKSALSALTPAERRMVEE